MHVQLYFYSVIFLVRFIHNLSIVTASDVTNQQIEVMLQFVRALEIKINFPT